jgi:hypothetical protein
MKSIAGLVVVAAIGGSGMALAAGNGSSQKAKAEPVEATTPDTDNVQRGDQTAPDTSTVAAKTVVKAAKEQRARKAHIKSSAGESGSASESTSASETSSASESGPGSEAAGNDGPGGHADEPGDPNADHQFEGQE